MGHHDLVAGTTIVVDRDGREHHRHGRRGRSSTGQRYSIEIRADNVKNALGEDKTGASRDVRGRRQDQWARAAVEIAKGSAVEEDFVVQLGRQFGTTPTRRPQLSPVSRTQHARDELALHIARKPIEDGQRREDVADLFKVGRTTLYRALA